MCAVQLAAFEVVVAVHLEFAGASIDAPDNCRVFVAVGAFDYDNIHGGGALRFLEFGTENVSGKYECAEGRDRGSATNFDELASS